MKDEKTYILVVLILLSFDGCYSNIVTSCRDVGTARKVVQLKGGSGVVLPVGYTRGSTPFLGIGKLTQKEIEESYGKLMVL